jgi:hypothetical protein
MKYKVLITRAEIAEMEVEADSAEEARLIAADKINHTVLSELGIDWKPDGGIRIESLWTDTEAG